MNARFLLIPTLAAALPAIAHAAALRSAEVTKVVNDVRLYQPAADGRPAIIGDKLAGNASLHTGRQSRTELVFQDNTLTRVGANSVFSFRSGTRDLEIGQGTLLLQVPKNAGGATIRTATVTAAITGTTTMLEYSPNKWFKFITLEGVAKLSLKGKKGSVNVPAGQMVVMDPNGQTIPAPIIINLAKLVATSNLAGRGKLGPLPQQAENLVTQSITQQTEERSNGTLLPTYVIIQGPGVRGPGQHIFPFNPFTVARSGHSKPPPYPSP